MGESTLKEKTSRGLFWGGMSSFLQQLLQAAFGIYLARTLSPDDYGLVGMLTVFNLLALTLQDGGFVSALINRKGLNHDDYNAVFWFNVFISLFCYLVLFCCAPLIARFFHHPELVKLARWSFLSFVLAGFCTAHRAYLTKKLMVKEMAIVNIAAAIISGFLGVYLAWRGWAYWTLVIQSLVLGFLTTAGYWFFSKWRPSFHFDFRPVKEMFRYSVKLLITTSLGILNSNLVTVILGRYYSAERVGYYTQANKWSQMGMNVLTGMVNSVAHPVLATVVEEQERQIRVFRKMVRFAAFVSFPAMFGLAFIAPEFITVALTDKWAESILLLQILCVGTAFTPVIHICSNLLLSRGKSSPYMWANIALFAVILALVFFLYPLGITAMVVGVTAANILWVFIWAALVRREIGYTFRHLLADLLPFLGVTLAAIAAVYFLTRGIGSPALSMALKIVLVAIIYTFAMWLSKATVLQECLQYLRNKIR